MRETERDVVMFVIIVLVYIVRVSFADVVSDRQKLEILPQCQACKVLTQSFKKGMDRTERYKFEGGDTAWEEKNQGKYANSEVRLVEIQEDMCKEVTRGQNQCHSLLSEHEELVEQWWFNKQPEHPDLYTWLCIETLRVCCPANHFGPDCKPCPGGVESPCNGNGKCKGAGTRIGSGECRCDKGYTGELCDQCSIGFYESPPEEGGAQNCEECHKSCKGHCREGGPKGCEVCHDGWLHHPEIGCQDIDECVASNPCGKNEFCANLEGTYSCNECFKGCDGCLGDGPDMCTGCKDGYTFQDGFCIDSETRMRSIHAQVARYLTYLGLCVATCIIFRKSPIIAGVVGLAVASYIGISEYTVTNSASPVEIRPVYGS